jgi:dihydrofolate reductase
MRYFKAIAAMSENRVIGAEGKIPWHLPEDFRFFRKMTTGHILVMGRRTFQAIGGALPNRHTIVLSRHFKKKQDIIAQPELGLFKWGTCEVAAKLEKTGHDKDERDIFICGGGQVYAEALPFCTDLYLTIVKRTVEGDTFFPEFESRFELAAEIMDRPDFKILHYRNTALPPAAGEV